jgi:hypothetical protein
MVCAVILLGAAPKARAQTPPPSDVQREPEAPAPSEPVETPAPDAPEVAPAEAEDVATQSEEQSEDKTDRAAPFVFNATLESSVGQGSFVANEYARNAYAAWGLTFLPVYQPIDGFRLSLLVSVAQELTDSDSDGARQQLLLSDTQLRASYRLLTIPVAEVGVTVEGRLYVPTSLSSQFETLALGTQARLRLSRSFGDFDLRFMTAFRKNFHSYESPVLELEDSPAPPPIHVRAGGSEDLTGSAASVGGNNVSYSFFNELYAAYNATEALSFGISYGITTSFTYASFERDELSSRYATDGRGQRDLAIASLFVGYELDERFSFSGGITTSASPKSADNQSFRFPFYDFESTADNLTLFYIDATVTEPFGD